ncbi:MAG: hypothetical protein LCH37_03750 [Bacteroidetes bacterium]|nr:hypothetical protein [Bacteroidota bacterium]MCK6609690.1 hypothetical protein [Bacteroidia bacterium]
MKSAIRFLIYLLIIVVVFLATWFISERYRAPEDKLREIYDQNFKPCLNYWTSDPNYTDSTGLSQIAMKYYEKGDYSTAIEGFQNFEPRTEEEGFYHLYLGLSYLKTDFDNLAIYRLQLATQSFRDFTNIQMSKWYLSLAYLKAGRDNEALEGFQDIVRLNARQRPQAEVIIERIEQAKNPLRAMLGAFKN